MLEQHWKLKLIKIDLCLKVKDLEILNDKGEIENYYVLNNSNIVFIFFFVLTLLLDILIPCLKFGILILELVLMRLLDILITFCKTSLSE